MGGQGWAHGRHRRAAGGVRAARGRLLRRRAAALGSPPLRRCLSNAEAVEEAKQLLAVAKRSTGGQIADPSRTKLVAEFERIGRSFEAGERRAQLLPTGSEERFVRPWLALLRWSDQQSSEQERRLVEISNSNDRTLGDAFTAGSGCEPIGEIFGDY